MDNKKLDHLPSTRSPDTQPQELSTLIEHPSLEKTEKTTTIITSSETSQIVLSLSWNSQGENPKPESWNAVKHPTPRTVGKGSRQFFFWETLITVGLLVMALWMQTLPTRQLPETMNTKSVKWFEMNNSQQSF